MAKASTFISNHAKEVWACDFLTQHTAFYAVDYVFVIMEIGSRRVVHVNVTTNPTLLCVKQEIREATALGKTPRFLVHDNDVLTGPTAHKARPPYAMHADRLPISLQDHDHPVRYRNIWLRELE